MRNLLKIVLLGALVAMGGKVCTAQASTQLPPLSAPRSSGRPSALPTLDGSDAPGTNPLAAIQEAQRTKAVANERQKRIVDDTTRLLQLATELKEAVAKTTKDQMSLEVIRKADEIEKLARDVKQRMKS